MCFNQPMSGILAAFGLVISIYMYYRTRLYGLAIGVFYFFLMEALQFFQYFYIDKCDSTINKILTLLGFLHICFQPLFAHIANRSASYRNKSLQKKLEVAIAFCAIGGIMLMSRYFFSFIPGYSTNNEGYTYGYNKDGSLKGSETKCGRSTEWIRGNEVCTFSGRKHLGWSIPLADPTYFIPGVQLHFFLMFVPFLVCAFDFSKGLIYGIDFKEIFAGLILLITGPVLAGYFTDDLMEQASIWCFFSIMQIFMMVLSVYDQVISPDWKAIEQKKKEMLIEEQKEQKKKQN